MFATNDVNAQALEVIWRTDGYKLGHLQQYPRGTTSVYSNLTPRSVYGGETEERPGYVVMFGLRHFLLQLQRDYQAFFDCDIDVVARSFAERFEAFTGLEADTSHLYELHELGYLPLRVKALPEGTLGLIGQPLVTITNTHPCAFWLVNYLETWLSSAMWQPITSATTAYNVRRLMDNYAVATGCDPEANGFLAHDFSYRGMAGIEAASASGAAHLLSFVGSDSLSSWDYITTTYPATKGTVQVGVPATEHAVMSAGAVMDANGNMDERDQVQHLLDTYPTGIVSVVSDTYDFWGMLTGVLPEFREDIMARDGKWVVRPDSGNPVDVVCGDPSAPDGSPERVGALQLLWDTFGGTTNSTGYKELDSHIGLIYGDSMTYARVDEMFARMKAAGFATNNIVVGLGSFSYQYVTRDTYGMAVKATSVVIEGKRKAIFKDPKTGKAKKSARGLLRVVDTPCGRRLLEDVDAPEEAWERDEDVLRTVFVDGNIVNLEDDFQVLRATLRSQKMPQRT